MAFKTTIGTYTIYETMFTLAIQPANPNFPPPGDNTVLQVSKVGTTIASAKFIPDAFNPPFGLSGCAAGDLTC